VLLCLLLFELRFHSSILFRVGMPASISWFIWPYHFHVWTPLSRICRLLIIFAFHLDRKITFCYLNFCSEMTHRWFLFLLPSPIGLSFSYSSSNWFLSTPIHYQIWFPSDQSGPVLLGGDFQLTIIKCYEWFSLMSWQIRCYEYITFNIEQWSVRQDSLDCIANVKLSKCFDRMTESGLFSCNCWHSAVFSLLAILACVNALFAIKNNEMHIAGILQSADVMLSWNEITSLQTIQKTL
jgi:hypothetical protein